MRGGVEHIDRDVWCCVAHFGISCGMVIFPGDSVWLLLG